MVLRLNLWISLQLNQYCGEYKTSINLWHCHIIILLFTAYCLSYRNRTAQGDTETLHLTTKRSVLTLSVLYHCYWLDFFLDPFLRGCEVCQLYCSTQDSWSKNLVLTLAGPVISKWSHQDHFQNVSEIIFILPGMVNSVLSLFLFFFLYSEYMYSSSAVYINYTCTCM